MVNSVVSALPVASLLAVTKPPAGAALTVKNTSAEPVLEPRVTDTRKPYRTSGLDAWRMSGLMVRPPVKMPSGKYVESPPFSNADTGRVPSSCNHSNEISTPVWASVPGTPNSPSTYACICTLRCGAILLTVSAPS